MNVEDGILPPTERIAKLIERYLVPVIIEHLREGKITVSDVIGQTYGRRKVTMRRRYPKR